MLTQWMNPLRDIKAENIQRQLDSISEKVASELLRKHETNSGEKEEEECSAPKCTKLSGETTSQVLSRVLKLRLPISAVIEGINAVLYDQLGFKKGPVEQYYELENSYIDKVIVSY